MPGREVQPGWRWPSRRPSSHFGPLLARVSLRYPLSRAAPELARFAASYTSILQQVLQSSATAPLTESLAALARAAVEAGAASSCVIAGAPVQDGSRPHWSWPPGQQLDPAESTDGDEPIISNGSTIGFVRVTVARPAHRLRPDRGDAQARFRTLLAAGAAQLLSQHESVRQLIALRADTVAARVTLAEERAAAAADMDGIRQALERDLHDGAQGDLVALQLQLAMLEANLSGPAAGSEPLPTGAWPTAPDPISMAERIVQQTRLVHERIQATAAGIVPPVLLDAGLAAALASHLPDLPAPGVLTIDAAQATGRRFPTDVEMAAYFVCLEAVSNTCKHAPGADVQIAMSLPARGLLVTISDTGPGFDGPGPPGAFRAIRERVRVASGELDVVSSVADGTSVTALFPY